MIEPQNLATKLVIALASQHAIIAIIYGVVGDWARVAYYIAGATIITSTLFIH